MADQYFNMDTMRFNMYDVHDTESILKTERYQDYDRESIDMLLDSIKDFSDKEVFPYFKEMDEKPVRYEDGNVIVHPQIGPINTKAAEFGMIGGIFDYEDGGLQMPNMVSQASYFIMDAANNNVSGYPGLTSGAAKLIASYATQDLKDKYLPNMLNGKWGGTMCLTEPHAGSSLSDIVTTATPTGDGKYKINGQKIWISGGDHQFADNIIHLLLARIEGAPAGTKGISLFIVPKKRLNDDGSMTPNGVFCAGDFQKLGQRGYCTTHLVFGEEEDCIAELVGTEHRGLSYMFQMMNGARISVGRHGAAIAMAAYYASLQYANERPQGRRLSSDGSKNLEEGQTLIINHPDVRRMLLLQKAIAEGSMSLIFQATAYADMMKTSEGEEKEHYNLLLEMLTPVVKTYPSEMGRVSASTGLQVLGGMGFSSETILQQYYRDIRIMAIYEGTTGIQSMDLLGRKVPLQNGRAMQLIAKEIQATIEAAQTYDELKPYCKVMGAKLKQTADVVSHLMQFAMKGDYERFLSDATIFMEMFGTIIVGWQWLKMAAVAKEQLVTGNSNYTTDFLEAKVHTMKFYFKYEMPKTNAQAETLTHSDSLTIVGEKELIH
ncbi:MAG: acyl-CoA dehydrogenase [Bacteroidota bacterium]